ncbi:MAG: hypothetical protein F2877_04430 [Actinobacteria bacterium]|uniref:Unannotated protein n=1 Tax=freshwater metagenome TaxID=449393 RepID=A0A6J7N757_9ZZZZ|nr:hypothetical protein [Actinomycetota bacterium]
MRQVYACRLDMVFESPARTARDFLKAKAAARQAVEQSASHEDWADDDRTEWEPAPYHRVTARRLVDDQSNDALVSLIWERPHGEPDLITRTEVLVGREGNRGWVVVREAIGSVDPTLTPPVLTPTAPPNVVQSLIDQIAFEDANRRLTSAAAVIGVDGVAEIDYFVGSGRRLPVVVLSDDGTGRITKIANGVAGRLVGLAHVFVLYGPGATVAFNRGIGVNHIVSTGGARLYWPRFNAAQSKGNRHWGAPEVMNSAGRVETAFITEVVRAIFDAGALRIPDPPLVERLEAARIRQRIAERRAELAERELATQTVTPKQAAVVEAQAAIVAEPVGENLASTDIGVAPEVAAPVQETPAEPAGRLDASEIEAWENDLRELESVRERLARVEVDRERLRRDFDHMRDQWVARAEKGEVFAGPPKAMSLVETVRKAELGLPNLVFLKSAITSAQSWQFDRTDDVWNAFLSLDFLAGRWIERIMNTPFAEAAEEIGLDWASDVSEVATNKYAADYMRKFEGRDIFLGPHVRMSGGRRLLRIYCVLDESPGPVGGLPVRRFIIGHVGKHLRDRTNND